MRFSWPSLKENFTLIYEIWLLLINYHLQVLKASSTRLQRNNFTSSNTSWRRLEDLLKTSCKDVLEDEKLLRWRRLQDVLKTCPEDVLKTYLKDVFKTSWRQRKCLPGISVCSKSKCVSNKSIFHKSISDKSKANPKCVT